MISDPDTDTSTNVTAVDVRGELRDALGAAVSFAPKDLEPLRADRSGQLSAAAPLALVTARSIADVQETMRIATRHRIPVVPRGAGTGLAGGAIGGAGVLVASPVGLARLLELTRD